jgi:hypothetical protein
MALPVCLSFLLVQCSKSSNSGFFCLLSCPQSIFLDNLSILNLLVQRLAFSYFAPYFFLFFLLRPNIRHCVFCAVRNFIFSLPRSSLSSIPKGQQLCFYFETLPTILLTLSICFPTQAFDHGRVCWENVA